LGKKGAVLVCESSPYPVFESIPYDEAEVSGLRDDNAASTAVLEVCSEVAGADGYLER
jgi:hypothetical protein